MGKHTLTTIATLIFGIVIGFLPAIFLVVGFRNEIHDLRNLITDETSTLTDHISKVESIIFFHTSCEAGDAGACEILKTMLEIYNEEDSLDT